MLRLVLQESHRQAGESQEVFARILSHFQQGNVDESYLNILKGRFCQISTNAKHVKWDNVPHLFYDNKSESEYNMHKLIGLDSPISKLTAPHNNGDAVKRYMLEANGLMLNLYLAVDAEVMLTSNLWVDVGLHNGAKGKVVDFLYKHADGPQTKNGKEFPEAFVVQFHSMAEGVEPFLGGLPNTVAVPVVLAKWRICTKYFIRKQFPLVLL